MKMDGHQKQKQKQMPKMLITEKDVKETDVAKNLATVRFLGVGGWGGGCWQTDRESMFV